jgi:hypothetical protein
MHFTSLNLLGIVICDIAFGHVVLPDCILIKSAESKSSMQSLRFVHSLMLFWFGLLRKLKFPTFFLRNCS